MRRIPNHKFCANLHQRLAETGSFQTADRGRVRTERTLAIEENVLQRVQESPRVGTRSVAHAVGVFRTSVWRTLREHYIYPYHVQLVQAMQPDDYAPLISYAYIPRKVCYISPFPAKVLFTDETSFPKEEIFNTYTAHFWTEEIPQATRRRAARIRFLVNVWAGIRENHLVGSFLLPFRLTGSNCLIFLQYVLPQLLGNDQISASKQQTMWFQHDGAPAHFSCDLVNHLDVKFVQQWIGCGGPVRWPAPSLDLLPTSCHSLVFISGSI